MSPKARRAALEILALDSFPENLKKVRSRINIASLAQAQRILDRLESSASKILRPLTEKFVKSDLSAGDLEITDGDKIMKIFEQLALEAFLLGEVLVERMTKHQTNLLETDRLAIKAIAETLYQSYWNELRKTKEKRFLAGGIFEFLTMLLRLTSISAYNQGTVSAGLQLSMDPSAGKGGQTDLEPVFEFVTMRDDKVDCKICAPLDGLIMKPTDLHFALPPLHPNCRCKLRIIKSGNIYAYSIPAHITIK